MGAKVFMGAVKTKERPAFVLMLRSRPHEIDETIRLRGALKVLLRRFGFRALRVEKVK
jgi:hypothetical protein